MADYKVPERIVNQLKIMFKIGAKKPESLNKSMDANITNSVYPLQAKHTDSGKVVLSKENFSPDVQRYWDYWLSDCHDSIESWKHRLDLYGDMDILFLNCPIVAKSAELTADEVIQADSNNQPIFIEAKAKVKKFIQNFFDEVGIYNLLRPTVMNIIQYGNAGWVLGFDNKGISDVVPVEPKDIRERLEFNPLEVEKRMRTDSFFKKYRALDRVEQLLTAIADKKDSTSNFKSYLIGFQIGEQVVPPWKFIHFRNMTNKSPFTPFGMPQFINALSPYRQYDAAMGLQQVARSVRFPKQVYKVNLPNIVSPTEKMQKATEFLNELQNSGFGTAKKEIAGLNDIIISIKDLFDYEQITPDIDLGKIDDIAMLKDDLINAVFIPRNLLDPNDSSFGDSGIALSEKFKPFARLIYRYQSILMDNITQLVKIHMIYSGEFKVDEIDFILNMPYPEAQTNPDMISSQSSLLSLANDIISAIQDKIAGGEALPPEIVKSVYNKFLPYDTQTIDDWIDDALKAKEKVEAEKEDMEADGGFEDLANAPIDGSSETDDEDMGNLLSSVENPTASLEQAQENYKKYKFKKRLKESISANKKWKKLEENFGKRRLQEMVADITFEEQQKNIRNMVVRGKHSFSSKNRHSDFLVEDLRKYDQKRLQLLKEELVNEKVIDSYTKEEVEVDSSFDHYVFFREDTPKEKLNESTMGEKKVKKTRKKSEKTKK